MIDRQPLQNDRAPLARHAEHLLFAPRRKGDHGRVAGPQRAKRSVVRYFGDLVEILGRVVVFSRGIRMQDEARRIVAPPLYPAAPRKHAFHAKSRAYFHLADIQMENPVGAAAYSREMGDSRRTVYVDGVERLLENSPLLLLGQIGAPRLRPVDVVAVGCVARVGDVPCSSNHGLCFEMVVPAKDQKQAPFRAGEIEVPPEGMRHTAVLVCVEHVAPRRIAAPFKAAAFERTARRHVLHHDGAPSFGNGRECAFRKPLDLPPGHSIFHLPVAARIGKTVGRIGDDESYARGRIVDIVVAGLRVVAVGRGVRAHGGGVHENVVRQPLRICVAFLGGGRLPYGEVVVSLGRIELAARAFHLGDPIFTIAFDGLVDRLLLAERGGQVAAAKDLARTGLHDKFRNDAPRLTRI